MSHLCQSCALCQVFIGVLLLHPLLLRCARYLLLLHPLLLLLLLLLAVVI